jgi:hypothetical protein
VNTHVGDFAVYELAINGHFQHPGAAQDLEKPDGRRGYSRGCRTDRYKIGDRRVKAWKRHVVARNECWLLAFGDELEIENSGVQISVKLLRQRQEAILAAVYNRCSVRENWLKEAFDEISEFFAEPSLPWAEADDPWRRRVISRRGAI